MLGAALFFVPSPSLHAQHEEMLAIKFVPMKPANASVVWRATNVLREVPAARIASGNWNPVQEIGEQLMAALCRLCAGVKDSSADKSKHEKGGAANFEKLLGGARVASEGIQHGTEKPLDASAATEASFSPMCRFWEILLAALWLLLLISAFWDCLKSNNLRKPLWIGSIILIPFFGALCYFRYAHGRYVSEL